MTKWHPATKFLLLGAIPLLAYLLWSGGDRSAPDVVASANRPSPTEPSGAQPGPNPPDVTFELPPLERFTAVVERPLFSPTRRMPVQTAPDEAPPPDEAPSTGPTGPAEPDLRFFGTERRDGTVAALVIFTDTSKVGRLAPGDMVGEWRVLSVDSNRLVLGQGDEQRTFEIFGAGARGTAPKPVPPGVRPKRNAMGQNGLPTSPPTFRPVAPKGVASPKGIPAPRNTTMPPDASGSDESASPDEAASPDDATDSGDATEPDGNDTPDEAAPPRSGVRSAVTEIVRPLRPSLGVG